MNILLVTPPLTQLNTPYPATTVLKGFLEANGQKVAQADLGIELVDAVYRRSFVERLFDQATERIMQLPTGLAEMIAHRHQYEDSVEQVIHFLRHTDDTLATRIANRSLLPEGPRFRQLADMEWAFGTSGIEDRARYLATLYVEDLADLTRETVDPHFDLIRYAEQLASYAPSFDPMEQALEVPCSMIDTMMLQLLQSHVEQSQPQLVGLAVPFPGCLYGALRCGQWLRQHHPDITVCIGGGFVNTEWRQLSDTRLFRYIDAFTLDDGELPLLRLAQYLELRQRGESPDPATMLVRTYYAHPSLRLPREEDFYQQEHPDEATKGVCFDTTPSFEGLPLHLYLSMEEMTNPMHRLWSNGRWNKMMMAHGCYWHRCVFCDTKLDYIGRYRAPKATQVVDRMERIMQQTGVSGFHFVDEALPPQLLREVSEEILRRRLTLSFWGNIRFEKAYTQELCDLMADAGCIAVSGGLEVASNRLLKLMDKGVTVEQTVESCRHFRQAGIMVHTYLMYGFPTETLQETLNALEAVRAMFDEGIVQSAYWHRYAMTAHSPSGQHPEQFGVCRTDTQPHPFCNNEVDYHLPDRRPDDPLFPYDIDAVGDGLRIATYNYMNGTGLDRPVRDWFAFEHKKQHHHKKKNNKR